MQCPPQRRTAARFVLVIGWLLSGACLPATNASPAPGLVGGIRLDMLPQGWRDDRNQAFALNDLAGRRVVLTMAYANCHRICPMTINALKDLQSSLDARGEQADFVIVGYDPDNEDAATWHQYRRSHHLPRANWHFLSGSHDDTEQLARQLGFSFWKYDEHVMHESRAVVFDARGLLTAEFGPDTRGWTAAL